MQIFYKENEKFRYLQQMVTFLPPLAVYHLRILSNLLTGNRINLVPAEDEELAVQENLAV